MKSMSGKIYAPLKAKELTGDPSDATNTYADISGSNFGTNPIKRVLNTDGPACNVQVDDTGGTIYVGISSPGVATSAAVWQILRLVESGGTFNLKYADGDAEFNNIWDNRAGLSYS